MLPMASYYFNKIHFLKKSDFVSITMNLKKKNFSIRSKMNEDWENDYEVDDILKNEKKPKKVNGNSKGKRTERS